MPTQDVGVASSADLSHLTDATKNWTNDWTGGYVQIVEGAGAGIARPIFSNTSNTLTLATSWPSAQIPDETSVYVVVKKSKMWSGPFFKTVRQITASYRAYNLDLQTNRINAIRAQLSAEMRRH